MNSVSDRNLNLLGHVLKDQLKDRLKDLVKLVLYKNLRGDTPEEFLVTTHSYSYRHTTGESNHLRSIYLKFIQVHEKLSILLTRFYVYFVTLVIEQPLSPFRQQFHCTEIYKPTACESSQAGNFNHLNKVADPFPTTTPFSKLRQTYFRAA